MLGTPPQVQRFDMSHRFGCPEPRRVRHGCVGSHVHEYAVSGEHTLASIAETDLHGTRRHERAVAPNEFSPRRLISVQMELNNPVHHLALAVVDSGHVDGERPGVDSELCMPGYKRSDLRRMDDVLTRQARHIRARSADILPIDNGGSPALFGHSPRNHFAGCAAAEHDDVIPFCCAHMIGLLLCGEKPGEDGRGVIRILFREKMATLHRLSFHERRPLTPNPQRTALFRIERIEGTAFRP